MFGLYGPGLTKYKNILWYYLDGCPKIIYPSLHVQLNIYSACTFEGEPSSDPIYV